MKKLQIVISVVSSADLSRGELRLLEALVDDPRFNLAALIEHNPKPTNPLMLRFAEWLEAPLTFPPFNFQTPAWNAVKDGVPILSPGAKNPPAPKTDVLVDFTGTNVGFDLLPKVVHGLWRLSAFQPSAGFFAARNGDGTTGVDLTCQPDVGKPSRTIASTQYGTKFLSTRNTAFIREKSVQLVLRELARLSMGGRLLDCQTTALADKPASVIDVLAYWRRATAVLFARAKASVGKKLGLRPGMFEIRIGRGDPSDFHYTNATPVVLSDKSFGADPFLFRQGKDLYLFFEEYDYARAKGHISVGRINGTHFEYLGPALDRPYHLSYPHIFSHGDKILMMPEARQSGRLEIWRATDFPTGWTLETTALEGLQPADPVLFRHDGHWWLFANISRDSFDDMCSELYLYQADGPNLETLKAHPLNPVVVNSTTARGAGRVFVHDGKLLRASQNNGAGTYGYGLNLMEITKLDMQDYQEVVFRRLTPDSDAGLIGCHHVDFDGGLFAIDVRKK